VNLGKGLYESRGLFSYKITHAVDDVTVDNGVPCFEVLRHYHVTVEMYICQKGKYGFIFGFKSWMELLFK
jgi:hypothetical protein